MARYMETQRLTLSADSDVVREQVIHLSIDSDVIRTDVDTVRVLVSVAGMRPRSIVFSV